MFIKASCKACKLDTYPHTYKLPPTTKTQKNKHFVFQIQILFFDYIEIKILLIFICNSVAVGVNLILKKARHILVNRRSYICVINFVITVWLYTFWNLQQFHLQKMNKFYFFSMAQQPLFGEGLLIIETSRSHSDTRHSIGLLWTSDQPDAKTSTWQHTTLKREIYIHALGAIRTHNAGKRPA